MVVIEVGPRLVAILHLGLIACITACLIIMYPPSWCQSADDICDPSARNQSHVGRVRFPLRAEMHGRGHITDSCFIAFITSKIC